MPRSGVTAQHQGEDPASASRPHTPATARSPHLPLPGPRTAGLHRRRRWVLPPVGRWPCSASRTLRQEAADGRQDVSLPPAQPHTCSHPREMCRLRFPPSGLGLPSLLVPNTPHAAALRTASPCARTSPCVPCPSPRRAVSCYVPSMSGKDTAQVRGKPPPVPPNASRGGRGGSSLRH